MLSETFITALPAICNFNWVLIFGNLSTNV